MNKLNLIFCLIFSLFFSFDFLTAQEASNCLDFDGTDEYVSSSGTSDLIDGVSTISLATWFYPTNGSIGWPDFDGVAGFRDDSGADFYLLMIGNNQIEGRYRPSSGTAFTLTYTGLGLNTWHHVALIYDGSELKLYANGVARDSVSASGTISTTTVSLEIGRVNYSTNFWLDGKVDETELWTKALTHQEILNQMHGQRSGSESNLALNYIYNSSTGSTVDDKTSNSNDGINQNMENGDWVTSHAPIGNSTARTGTDLRGIWEATGTSTSFTSDGFTLKVGTALAEENYAVFSHDNAGGSATTDDVPSGVAARYEQIWYLDEYGAVTSDMTFDLSTISGNTVVAGAVSNYRLLYRSGTSGEFTNLMGGSSITNIDQVTFASVGLTDGYYTIGAVDVSSSPLPVSLVDFYVKRDRDGGAEISWSTEVEYNSDYFLLEKSINGIDFTIIAMQVSNQISTEKKDYLIIDPAIEDWKIYYRLTEFDLTGASKELGMVALDALSSGSVNQESKSPLIMNNEIEINVKEESLSCIKVFSIDGKLVSNFNVPLFAGKNQIPLRIKSITNNVFFVLICYNNFSYLRKGFLSSN